MSHLASIALASFGVGLVLSAGIAPGSASDAPGDAPAARLPAGVKDVQQEVFFAVLAGLYRDGVDTETARVLASTDAATGAPLYFIQSCPLCMPAFDAVRVYAGRPAFAGDKEGRTTFGPGLPDDVRGAIASDQLRTRLEAFQSLVEGWISAHLRGMRLTAEESLVWRGWIRDLKEKGNSTLEGYLAGDGPYAEVYRGWKSCAVCEGSSAGAE